MQYYLLSYLHFFVIPCPSSGNRHINFVNIKYQDAMLILIKTKTTYEILAAFGELVNT